MYKVRNTISKAMMKAYVNALATSYDMRQKVKSKLSEKNGSFFTEHGLAVVITVVIAAIVITAIVALFKNKIFPELNNKVDDFFGIS